MRKLIHKFELHTHTHLTALFPGLPGRAGTKKVKPCWISLKQETVSGSGISWAVCKSSPRSRQITTPAPHHSVFYSDAFPAAQPTASKHWSSNSNHCKYTNKILMWYKGYKPMISQQADRTSQFPHQTMPVMHTILLLPVLEHSHKQLCWTQAQKGCPGSNHSRDAVVKQSQANCSRPLCLCSPNSKIGSSPLKGCGNNCRPGGK